MHPELTSHLAGQRRRAVTAAADRAQLATLAQLTGRNTRWPAVRHLMPRYRLTWTSATLAMADSSQPRRSWVLVISATRFR